MAIEEFDDKDADNVNLSARSRSPSARKRRDSYDYTDTVQLLGKFRVVKVCSLFQD